MASLRLCTHIKTNGVKCGSPALRHHTLCYFHYQWQRRDQRRIRLGSPIGMGKNSGIELPLLDGPEAILISIMEIQHALLDQRIPIKMGTALLYSLQLALQAKISAFGLGHSGSVRECPELNDELELERAKAMRPAKEKCAACPKRDDCLSPRNCRKLPKVPGYHRLDNRLVPNTTPDSSFRAEHAQACAVEGPAFSPTEAPALDTNSSADTTTASLRESSPERKLGESSRKFPPAGAPRLPLSADVGSANARRQIDATEEKQTVLRLRDSRRYAQDDTSKKDVNPHAHCILGSKPNAHIDLAAKFPQLAETKQAENQGVV